MKDWSDLQLIQHIKQGDQQSFRILVDRYEQKVASTVINMLGNTDLADDVGQEVFIRFYNHIGQFKGDAALGTYLTRIAINLSLNELSRQKIRNLRYLFFSRNEDDETTYQIPDSNRFEEKLDAKNLVQAALIKLEPKLRSVLVLRMIEGYDTKQTAEILELPMGTVLSRLSRAQDKLKEILIKMGYQP